MTSTARADWPCCSIWPSPAGLANRLERGEDAPLPEPELKGLEGRWQLLRHLAAVLGLRSEAEAASSLDDGAIDAAIAARKAAKAAKDYARPTGSGMSSPPKGWS